MADYNSSYTGVQIDAAVGAVANKADKTEATPTTAGLMSAADKAKLNGIAVEANKYTLPAATSSVLGGVKSGTDITVDASGNVSVKDDSHSHVISNVDDLQTALDGKVDDSKVLTDVPANAKFTDTVYTHPDTHSADIITDGTNNKAFTATEKTKLAGIDTGANNYTHPTSHLPSIITQNASNRFVTDTEKSTWNSKANRSSGTATLSASSWVGSSAPYTYNVTISGITSADVLDVKAAEGTDKAAADLIREAWGKAIDYYKPQTSTNKLTFYASEKPAVSIPIYWRLIK